MANTRELRRRIRSVQNTSQITKAMQMIAATKMRKAQNQAMAGRPYNQTLKDLMANLISKAELVDNPFLTARPNKLTAVIVLTTDKSLCGALNTNLFRALSPFIKDQKDLIFYTIGRKGRDFLSRTRHKIEADFENAEIVNFKTARVVAKAVIDAFLANQIDSIYLAYPHFDSTLRQVPIILPVLPIQAKEAAKSADNSQFIFEPDPVALLEGVINHFVEAEVYQALLETKASEHSARMIAMKNATDNAKELVSDLKLTYNQTRQSSITSELLEITSAGAALA